MLRRASGTSNFLDEISVSSLPVPTLFHLCACCRSLREVYTNCQIPTWENKDVLKPWGCYWMFKVKNEWKKIKWGFDSSQIVENVSHEHTTFYARCRGGFATRGSFFTARGAEASVGVNPWPHTAPPEALWHPSLRYLKRSNTGSEEVLPASAKWGDGKDTREGLLGF